MKVIIAAGGTAGHINPGLAIAQYIKSKHPEAEIMFVGRKSGMEYGLVTKAGYEFCHMEVTGFQRKITPQNIGRNIITVKNLLTAGAKSKKILKDFKPDIVIGCGGYVSGPIVLQAAKMGIKTAIHEQNAFPGVTNKILAKNVDTVFLATEKAKKYLDEKANIIVCGNPVRMEIQSADSLKAKKELGVEGKTVLLSFGGSLGAMMVNNRMKSLVLHNRDRKDIVHFHVVGKYDDGDFVKFLSENGIQQSENLKVFEYLYDIPKYMAAADIIISRCGALTIAEIGCMGKASILIPSPNVVRNHQEQNAREFEKCGAAAVITEAELTPERLYKKLSEMTEDKEGMQKMSENLKKLARTDALEKLYGLMLKMADKNGKD